MAQAWQQRVNTFAEKLGKGSQALAMWVTIPWPPVLEILGSHGLDAAIIDLEHGSFGLAEVERMIVAAELAGVTPMVRPAGIEPGEITRILDAGAQGIVFPQIADKASAQRAVSSTRFPPRGLRGWGGAHTRRARWQGRLLPLEAAPQDGSDVNSKEYVQKAENDVLIILLVESVAGANNIDAILDVPGISAVMFGWGDYAVEVDFDMAKADEAGRKVHEACRRRGIGIGIPFGPNAAGQFYPGCFYRVGIDAMLMSRAFEEAVGKARSVVSGDVPPLQSRDSKSIPLGTR